MDSSESKPDYIWKDHKSGPLPWQAFEDEVADYIVKILESGMLGLDKRLTRVTSKCPLFSKDRDADIVFDVVLELFAASNSEQPLLIWI